MSREFFQEEIANLKKELEGEKSLLQLHKEIPGKKGCGIVAKHKSKIKELDAKLKDTTRLLGEVIANGPSPI